MLELLLIITLIVGSLFLLVKGADYLVDGAADTARWLKVRPMLVGLTVVAFGTSLPELMVSLFSGLSGNTDLSIGNIIGSNTFNIAGIIGVSALIMPLVIRSKTLMYEFPIMIIAAFLLLILADDQFIFQQSGFSLSRIDGLIMLFVFVVFLYYIYLAAQKERQHNGRRGNSRTAKVVFKQRNPQWKNGLYILGGLAALVIGGRLFTYAAVRLATLAGISEAFIGLTIAAIGTSLPELFTSVVAAWKKEADIAVGNIVGSNIFNILFILGVVSLIKPLAANAAMIAVDGIVMVFVSLVFLFFAARYGRITKWMGIVFLVMYLAYFSWLVGNL